MKRLIKKSVNIGGVLTLKDLRINSKTIDLYSRDEAFVYIDGDLLVGSTHPDLVVDWLNGGNGRIQNTENIKDDIHNRRNIDNVKLLAFGHIITLLDGQKAAVVENNSIQGRIMLFLPDALFEEYGNIQIFTTNDDKFSTNEYSITRVR